MSAFLAPAWQFYTTVPPLWYQVYLVLFLLLSAALLSGLMFGLNALDWRKLRMLEELGDEEDQAMARHLLRLRRHGVWLCIACSIWSGCGFGNGAWIVFRMVRNWDNLPSYLPTAAGLSYILLLTTILPLIILTQNPMVWIFKCDCYIWMAMILTSPVSYPLAWLINRFLGPAKDALYTNSELALLLRAHSKDKGGGLDPIALERFAVEGLGGELHRKEGVGTAGEERLAITEDEARRRTPYTSEDV